MSDGDTPITRFNFGKEQSYNINAYFLNLIIYLKRRTPYTQCQLYTTALTAFHIKDVPFTGMTHNGRFVRYESKNVTLINLT